jgi:hypothetical protein
MGLPLTKREKAAMRRLADSARMPRPVIVVDGDAPPRLVGDHSYWAFRGSGERVYSDLKWLRKVGHDLIFHPSTRRVEVGGEWLERWRARKEWAREHPNLAKAFAELGGTV